MAMSALTLQADEMLSRLAADDCPTNCEFDCTTEQRHENLERSGGNDDGEIHECAISANGCQDHSCQPDSPAAQLAAILPRLDGESIQRLAKKHSDVILIKSHGYRIFATLEDFPPAFRRYYLQKELAIAPGTGPV